MISKIERLDVAAGGRSFHALAAGPKDGAPVLLLHGFPEFSAAWRKQVDALVASGHRVVAPDQRGYGESDKPTDIRDYRLEVLAADVVAIADALGWRRFSLVGHDWGGIVAWRVAADHPIRILRLVILNAPNLDVVGAHVLRSPMQLVKSSYVAFFQLPWLPELALSASNHGLLAASLRLTSVPGTFSDTKLEEYREAWSRPGALTGMLNWYRALPLKASHRPKRVIAKTLVLWGDRDTALQPSLADESASLCTDARVVHIAEGTHWIHHEQADRVNGLIAEFIRT